MALKSVRINQSGVGTVTVEAAVPGQRHYVTAFSLDISATTALPQFESAATVIAGPYGRAVGHVFATGSRTDPLFWTATNEALEVVVAGAGTVQGFVTYFTTE